MSVAFDKTIPILRIFDLARAREFYVDFLGFATDWEHRFDDSSPVFLQVSRGSLTFYLSEHHGDGSPGHHLFVWMTGLDAYHAEVSAKGYRFMRPGIETTFYKSRAMTVIDPFGNQIRFNEKLPEP